MIELEADDSKKHKIKTIQDSTIFIKKLKSGYLLELNNLIFWKNYPKKENT